MIVEIYWKNGQKTSLEYPDFELAFKDAVYWITRGKQSNVDRVKIKND